MAKSTVNVYGKIGSMGEFDITEEWDVYQERLEQYMLANGIEDSRKAAVLLTVLGPKTYRILRDLCDPNQPSSKTYEELVEILMRQFSPKVAVFRKRQEFYTLQQRPQEPVNEWFARVKNAAITYLRGGDIGLLITEYIGLLTSLDWGMRQWSELENQMTSTERIIEYKYIENEPERPKVTSLPKSWPSEGRLEFKNVHLKYNETDPYVLNDICFTVQPKEKIGIVGRTGAGKSSIITSLFQLYPLEGSIWIDGIDTTKLPLEDVRNKISIIPQEPVLFSGTMRKNLDPFEEYSDEVLWNALDQVELKETVDEMAQGLNSMVSDSGSNFSVGERQLVCLARALIRHNKILVLDEATANVDPYTDSLIQKTIRNKFADCTVLTVAHRLNTVMDSDKILVMRAGKVEEFDHPHLLLEKKEGLLYGLVQATGETTSKQLENIAKENYETNMANAQY